MGLTGTVTLDAQGNSDAVFIFQAGSTLTTASNSTVDLINGANPCNVFWQVESSATLGTNTTFVGTVLALTSITVTTGTTVEGRLQARNGSVTLDNNTVDASQCAPPTTEPTEPSDTTEPTTPTTTATTDPGDSTTPTTTEGSEPTTSTTTEPSEPTTSVPTPPTTTVNDGAPVIPIFPILLPAILIGGSVAAAPIIGPMIGQSLEDLNFQLPELPDLPPLGGSAMPGPAPVQSVAPAPMAPGPESPNGSGGEPGAEGREPGNAGGVAGPVTVDTAVLMTGSMGDFELPLPAGVGLPPLPFIR